MLDRLEGPCERHCSCNPPCLPCVEKATSALPAGPSLGCVHPLLKLLKFRSQLGERSRIFRPKTAQRSPLSLTPTPKTRCKRCRPGRAQGELSHVMTKSQKVVKVPSLSLYLERRFRREVLGPHQTKKIVKSKIDPVSCPSVAELPTSVVVCHGPPKSR